MKSKIVCIDSKENKKAFSEKVKYVVNLGWEQKNE